MQKHTKYDYAIVGTGLSGLLLAYEMSQHEFFIHKKILLIDKEIKNTNDRTWCFWSKEQGIWENTATNVWEKALFQNDSFSSVFPLRPYKYYRLESKNFYQTIWNTLQQHPNIQFLQAFTESWKETNEEVLIQTNQGEVNCKFLFHSILQPYLLQQQQQYAYLKQHFIGWFVKTEEEVFNPEVVSFMDFKIPQQGNTRFMYVLPFSKTEALVEYTLFSADLLNEEAYENAIETYLVELGVKNYTITEKEQGNIPMTCYSFSSQQSKRVIPIGSAGGWTKASTGYTFYPSTKKAKQLVQQIIQGNMTPFREKKYRFWWYDLILLEVLDRYNYLGTKLFGILFKKNTISTIFDFLNEESTPKKEVQIMMQMPPFLFWKATMRALNRFLFK